MSSPKNPNEVLHWLHEFKIDASQANWQESTAISLLKMMIRSDLVEDIQLKRSIETCEQAIIELMFPRQDRIKYD